MIRLRVWAAARPMGWFGHAQAAYFFEYDPEWISDGADCNFGFQPVLKELEKMALTLPGQWQKTQARLIKEHKPSEAEHDLLARMTAIFDAQCKATLLMLGRTDD